MLAPVIAKRGQFQLRSGRTSDHYINVREGYGDPVLLKGIAREMLDLIDRRTTCVVGYGFGGIPLATALSLEGGFKLCTVREKPKEHGMGQQIESYTPTADDFLTIPDDVFTSGSSLREATEIVKSTGATIVGYCVVINREQGDPSILGAPFKNLYTGKEVMEEFDRLKALHG